MQLQMHRSPWLFGVRVVELIFVFGNAQATGLARIQKQLIPDI